MTDILERLRLRAKVGDGWTRPDSAEAADEIERLRTERDAYKKAAEAEGRCSVVFERERDALLIERDRLREALREIADAVGDYETADDRLLAGARVGAAWHNARAALGDGTP